MAGVQIGALHVSLSADSAAFDQGMNQAQATAEDAMGEIGDNAKKLAGVLAGLFAVDLIKDRIKEQIDYADGLADVAARANSTAEALSAMEYALHFSDATLQDYTGGLQKLEQNMSAASEGAKEQSLVFETLGIKLREQDGMLRKSGDVMLEFADVMAGMENGATKTQLAMDVLGKSAGPALLPFLSQGKEGIKQFTDEAEKMGLVVSTEFSDAAGQLNDNLDKISFAATGAWRVIAEQLTPALVDISAAFLKASADGTTYAETLGKIGAGVARFTGGVVIGATEGLDVTRDLIGQGMALLDTGFTAFTATGQKALSARGQFTDILTDTSAWEKYKNAIGSVKTAIVGLSDEERKYAEWKQTEDAVFAGLAENTQRLAAIAYEEQKKRNAEEESNIAKLAKIREDAAKKFADALQKQSDAVSQLAQTYSTEIEKEQKYYDEKVKFLNDANNAAFSYANQRHDLLQKLEASHLAKMQTLQDAATQAANDKRIAELTAELDPMLTSGAYDAQQTNRNFAETEDFNATLDSVEADLAAKNALKLDMHKDFVSSFLTLDMDRINGAITNGDKELEARKAQMAATVTFFNQGLASMAAGQGKAAKAAQAIQKAQALYEIGVNTYRAATGAYAALSPIPFIGPALGVAAAAAAIAFGGSMAQGVMSGGGGAGAVTGGAPPALPSSSSPTSQADQRAAEPTITTYVRIPEDAILTGRKMLDFIDEALGDGKQLNNLRFVPA